IDEALPRLRRRVADADDFAFVERYLTRHMDQVALGDALAHACEGHAWWIEVLPLRHRHLPSVTAARRLPPAPLPGQGRSGRRVFPTSRAACWDWQRRHRGRGRPCR